MKPLQASGDSPGWKKPFFIIWTGQAFSILGSYLVQFALVWYLTKTTGSATILATSSLVAVLPEIVLGPFAGALIDRWDRRRVMILADAFTALVSLGLAVLIWTGAIEIWHIYVAVGLRSLGGSFHRPAFGASTTLMVPREHLPRVAGMNQMLNGALGVLAPPLGALLMELLPVHQVIALDLVTATLAILPLTLILIPRPQRADLEQSPTTPQTLIKDVRAGLSFLVRWRGVLMVVLLAMVLNFLINPAFSLLPLLVTDHFGGGVVELGWTDAAWALGIVGGGLLLSAWGGFRNRVITALMGITGTGVGVALVGAAPSTAILMAVGCLFVAGVMNALCNGSFFALMQEHIPPEMQGRVMAVITSGCAAAIPLGMLAVGPLADAVGVRPIFIWAGGIQAVLGLASFLYSPIVHLERNRPTDFVPATAD